MAETLSIRRRHWTGYAIALGAVALASLLRLLLLRTIGSGLPFLTFFPAVIVAALFGGRGPGLLATGASAVAAWVLVETGRPPVLSRAADEIGLALFLAISLFIVWLCDRYRRADRSAAQAAAAQARLAAIVESSDDAIIAKSLDGTIQSWNAGATRLFGYEAHEAIGRSIHMLVPPDRRSEEDGVLLRLGRGERVEHLDTVRVRKDGSSVEVSITVSPVRDASGRVIGASKIARDVAEPKRAQRQLGAARDAANASLAQWRAVVGTMTEGVVVADARGDAPEWNAAALEILGFADVEEVRRNQSRFPDILELTDGDGRAIPPADWPMSRVLRGETFARREVNVRRLDVDHARVVSYGGSPVRGADGAVLLAVLTLHDVTEERRAQAAAGERAGRLRAVFEQSAAGIVQLDMDGRFVLANQWLCRLLGYGEAELLALRADDVTHPDDRDRNAEVMARSRADGGDYRIEKRYVRRDGSIVWVNVSSGVVRDGAGRQQGFLGVITDVTERRRAEERLARQALLLAHVRDSVIVTDLRGIVTFWNEGANRLFGWTASEMLGRPLTDRMPEAARAGAAERVRRLASEGGEFDGEWLDHRKDGSPLWIEATTRRILDSGGEPVGIMGVSRDVSERVRAASERERLLVEGRAQLARTAEILESFSDAFYAVDARLRFTYVNRRAEEFWGRGRERMIGRALAEEFPEAVGGESYQKLEQVMASRAPARFETVSPLMDRWIEAAIYPEANGGASCYFRDISDRKRAEAALRESEERFRALFERAAVGMAEVDLAGNLLRANDAFCAITGYPADELVGLPTSALTHPEDVPGDDAARDEALGEATATVRRETRYVRKDGGVVWVTLAVNVVRDEAGRARHLISAVSDITARKDAEAALRDSERRLRAVIEQSSAGIAHVDLEGRIFFANQRYCQIVGYPNDEVLGLRVHDLTHPDDVARTAGLVSGAAASGNEYGMEKRYVRKDGSVIWVDVSASVLKDDDGRPRSITGVVIDISARKRAENALRDGEERLQLALSIAQMGTFRIDLLTDAVTVNEAGRAIYGWPEEEPLTFSKVQARFHPDDRDGVLRRVGEAFVPGGPGAFEVEHRIVRTDGTVRWIRVRGRAFFEAVGGEPRAVRSAGTYLDVTPQKLAEREREQLLAAERAARAEAERADEAKSDFLAALSHELRTPLTPVLLTVSLMEAHPGLPEELRADVATIRRNVELESRLIGDLLDITRIAKGKLVLDVQDVDLHAVVRSAIDICQREASANLVVDLAAARHAVRGDATRLQQVFWNLINNAIKFTGPDGTITVRSADAGGGSVRVEVSDTGVGIDPQVLPKLFNAFEQGEVRAARQQAGLGLGLAISKRLTEAQGGAIWASSAGRGRGSTFAVILPTVEHAPTTVDAMVPANPDNGQRRPLRVLLVEDNEPTLAALTRLLRRIGHRVTPVSTVASATAAARGEEFDLIISDLGLPDGSGLDVMRKLRDRYAGRAIALTGYGMDSDVAASLDAGFAEHLTKPVDLKRLEAAIDAVTRR